MTNMTFENLKDIVRALEELNTPDDTPVIIPVITEEDSNNILAFRHVRTAGILRSDYEQGVAICFNSAADGLDISSQIKRRHTVCERVLF